MNPISMINWLKCNLLDISLETFLEFMQWVVERSDDDILVVFGLHGFRKNIENFEAVYVFVTQDGGVQATAKFHNGYMEIDSSAAPNWDLKVVFKDVNALWRLMMSGGGGVVDAMMANDTQVYGNLNYLYRFGFLVKDLVGTRLGIPLPA